jgi:hypothetical protein
MRASCFDASQRATSEPLSLIGVTFAKFERGGMAGLSGGFGLGRAVSRFEGSRKSDAFPVAQIPHVSQIRAGLIFTIILID